VVWIRLAHRIDAAMLGDAPRCRLLATPVTGIDHVDLEACGARGVRVISLKGETEFLKRVRATAEMTVGLALALVRNIPQASTSVKWGIWKRDLFEGTELFEKTAGIVGVGRLGTIVAGLLHAFGMNVIACDPRSDFPAGIERRSLDELLAVSDLVSLHVDLNPSTHHLIGARELSRMKRSAILINTARGGVIDEAALLDALEQRRIAGAALDVLASEPHVSPDDPLIEYARHHDNLLIVPHLGGKTAESMEKTEVFLAERVKEALMS
jgi:D-3-phosphoglycerate dehydrogenase